MKMCTRKFDPRTVLCGCILLSQIKGLSGPSDCSRRMQHAIPPVWWPVCVLRPSRTLGEATSNIFIFFSSLFSHPRSSTRLLFTSHFLLDVGAHNCLDPVLSMSAHSSFSSSSLCASASIQWTQYVVSTKTIHDSNLHANIYRQSRTSILGTLLLWGKTRRKRLRRLMSHRWFIRRVYDVVYVTGSISCAPAKLWIQRWLIIPCLPVFRSSLNHVHLFSRAEFTLECRKKHACEFTEIRYNLEKCHTMLR